MKKRRYKRRYRRRTMSKPRRYMRRRREGASEVKYITYSDANKAIQNSINSVASTTSSAGHQYLPDLLSNIVQGTGQGNRIGARIFVKKIVFKFYFNVCVNATNDPTSTILLRLLIHNSRAAAGAPITNFYRVSTVNPATHGLVNRQNYSCYADRTLVLTSNGINVATSASAGGIRLARVTLPMNRHVTFDSGGATREDFNIRSLSVLGHNGAGTAGSYKQIACMDYTARVYFTDA